MDDNIGVFSRLNIIVFAAKLLSAIIQISIDFTTFLTGRDFNIKTWQ